MSDEALNRGIVLRALADLPADTMIDREKLAECLGTTTRTVFHMVDRQELPSGLTVGDRTLWMVGRVLAHLHKRFEKAEKRGA